MAENNFYQIHESKIYKGKLDNGFANNLINLLNLLKINLLSTSMIVLLKHHII